MAMTKKTKRYLNEQEDRLLRELRSCCDGTISKEEIDLLVKTVAEQQPLRTAIYDCGDQSAVEFMRDYFGSESDNDNTDEPDQVFLIDFTKGDY